jgi:hypothetical protein
MEGEWSNGPMILVHGLVLQETSYVSCAWRWVVYLGY